MRHVTEANNSSSRVYAVSKQGATRRVLCVAVAIALAQVTRAAHADCSTANSTVNVSSATSIQASGTGGQACTLATNVTLNVSQGGMVSYTYTGTSNGDFIDGVYASGTGITSGNINNAGSILANDQTASVQGQARAIEINSGAQINNITNSGLIQSSGHAIELGFDSSTGEINAGSNTATAILNTTTGVIQSTGTSIGPGTDNSGIRLATGSTIIGVIANEGLIEGGHRGIVLADSASSINGVILNSGASPTEDATIEGGDYGILNYGTIGNGKYSVENDDFIEGTNAVSYGIYNAGTMDAMDNEGTISGKTDSILNTGKIIGDIDSIGDLIGTLENDGSISGAIVFGGRLQGDLINSSIGIIIGGVTDTGLITGAVTLNSASLTISGNSAEIDGAISAENITVAGNYSSHNNAAAASALAFTGGSSTIDHVWSGQTVSIANADVALGASGQLSAASGNSIEVSSGVLALGAAAGATAVASGSLGSNVDLADSSAVLLFNHNDSNLVFGQVISGSGAVAVAAGTTTLAAINTYSGGTRISGGELIGNSTSFGSGAIVDNAALVLDQASDASMANAISGSGTVSKLGAGTLITTSTANDYSGATNLSVGTLQAGAVNTFSANSAYNVSSGATLDAHGFNQKVAALNNAGTVALGHGSAGTVFTVSGDYVGQNGLLSIDTVLGADNSVSDLLAVGGNVSGNTTIAVTNTGGLGAQTTGNGIELVSVGGSSAGNAFALSGTHVDAGAYEYFLYKGDSSGSGDNWYLRSQTEGTSSSSTAGNAGSSASTSIGVNSNPSSGVTSSTVTAYRPDTSLFAALRSQLRQADGLMLGNLHQRDGETPDALYGTDATAMSWARVIDSSYSYQQHGTVSPHSQGDIGGTQVGSDVWQGNGLRAGAYLTALHSDLNVDGFNGGSYGYAGRSQIHSYGLGLYGTYTMADDSYLDLVVQQGVHHVSLSSDSQTTTNTYDSSLLSAEIGKPFALGGGWRIEPQLQAIYDHLSGDNTSIAGDTTVHQASSNSLTLRAGVRIAGSFSLDTHRFDPYLRVNVYHSNNGADEADFSTPAASTVITSSASYNATEVALGGTYALDQRAQLYAEFGHTFANGSEANRLSSALYGNVGLRIRW